MFLTLCLPASARLLEKKTIVRSSRLSPSSCVCFNCAKKSRKVFNFSVSSTLSCADLGRILAVVRTDRDVPWLTP